MFLCKFEKGQGLGNQLWNYASIKSIANKMNVDFGILNYENFKGKEFLILDGIKNPDIIQTPSYSEEMYFDKKNNFISSCFDENVFNLQGDWILEGLFQSEKYLCNEKSFLNQAIKIKNPRHKNINSHECILNIRGGEYKKHKDFILPRSYWVNAMQYMEKKYTIKNFIAVTDDYDYCKYMFPDMEIIHGSVEKCYQKIYFCKNIVVSNSTFSYFPIKTSTLEKNVLAPYNWARFNSSSNFWCSPCNCYSDWSYLDKNGNIFDFEKASLNAEMTTKKYKKSFPIYDESKHKLSKSFISRIIPKSIKEKLLIILSKLFPSKF